MQLTIRMHLIIMLLQQSSIDTCVLTVSDLSISICESKRVLTSKLLNRVNSIISKIKFEVAKYYFFKVHEETF